MHTDTDQPDACFRQDESEEEVIFLSSSGPENQATLPLSDSQLSDYVGRVSGPQSHCFFFATAFRTLHSQAFMIRQGPGAEGSSSHLRTACVRIFLLQRSTTMGLAQCGTGMNKQHIGHGCQEFQVSSVVKLGVDSMSPGHEPMSGTEAAWEEVSWDVFTEGQ